MGCEQDSASKKLQQLFHDQLNRVGMLSVKTFVNPHPIHIKDSVKEICRDSNKAKDRVLFYYFGSCEGLPQPQQTFFFTGNARQSVNMIDVLDILSAMPQIYIFDTAGAGQLLSAVKSAFWDDYGEHQKQEDSVRTQARKLGSFPQLNPTEFATQDADIVVRNIRPTDPALKYIFFGSCSAGEAAPAHPLLPNDIFTACLNTPMKMALLWFIIQHRGQLWMSVDDDLLPLAIIHALGSTEDVKGAPLNELKKVYDAIADTIAWQLLPTELYHRLFREDPVVVAYCRNFFLAQQIIRALGRHPVSFPQIPAAQNHHLWLTWDAAIHGTLSIILRHYRPSIARQHISSRTNMMQVRWRNANVQTERKNGVVNNQYQQRQTFYKATNQLRLTLDILQASEALGMEATGAIRLPEPFTVGVDFFSDELSSTLSFLRGSRADADHFENGHLPLVYAGLCSVASRILALHCACHFLDRGLWATEVFTKQLKIHQEILRHLWSKGSQQPEAKPMMVFIGCKSVFFLFSICF